MPSPAIQSIPEPRQNQPLDIPDTADARSCPAWPIQVPQKPPPRNICSSPTRDVLSPAIMAPFRLETQLPQSPPAPITGQSREAVFVPLAHHAARGIRLKEGCRAGSAEADRRAMVGSLAGCGLPARARGFLRSARARPLVAICTTLTYRAASTAAARYSPAPCSPWSAR
jgi:hypothetical protein